MRSALIRSWAKINKLSLSDIDRSQTIQEFLENGSTTDIEKVEAQIIKKTKSISIKQLEGCFESFLEKHHRKSQGAVYTPNYIIDYLIIFYHLIRKTNLMFPATSDREDLRQGCSRTHKVRGDLLKASIDDTDSRIIHLLKQNGRMPNTEIAKRLKVSDTAIRKRLRRLIDKEIIQIVAVVNQHVLGYELEGNIQIKVDPKKTIEIKSKLDALKGLWYIAYLTGASDFDMEFSVKSQEELRILIERIARIDGVKEIETSIRLELVKNRYDWETPKLGLSTD